MALLFFGNHPGGQATFGASLLLITGSLGVFRPGRF
jgi:hypothetical protein